MKKNSLTSTISFLFVLVMIACQKDTMKINNPDAEDIDGYIKALNYSPESLLNTLDLNNLPSHKTEHGSKTKQDVVKGMKKTCKTIDYTLESNFSDVAILQPTKGIIYPGALVYGNANMLDGLPDPISVDKGSVTLSVDLPGIGEDGTMIIEDPSNSTVQATLDNTLEKWHDKNGGEEAYKQASQTISESSTFYSSEQMSMELGLNVKWATTSFQGQMNIESTKKSKVAMRVFKQIFYTVSMNTPLAPSSVFGENVSLEEVQSLVDASKPPAYVSSVSYGRIILIKIENTSSDLNVDLEAILTYATSETEIDSEFEEQLRSTKVTVMTFGGDAEITSELNNINADEEGNGYLIDVITGENALYSRSNPGLPISYSIRFLKDNHLAKMGYTTDYVYEDCSTQPFDHEKIKVTNDLRTYNLWITYSYKILDPAGEEVTEEFEDVKVKDEHSKTFNIPTGAWDVEFRIDRTELGGGRKKMLDKSLGHIQSEKCYKVYRSGVSIKLSTSCK